MRRFLISFAGLRTRLGGCDYEYGADIVAARSPDEARAAGHEIAAQRLGAGWMNITVKIEREL
jgi:predicted NAD-dependent protein-ADP-ribosyltransferase YbiA (DUF1768 family)